MVGKLKNRGNVMEICCMICRNYFFVDEKASPQDLLFPVCSPKCLGVLTQQQYKEEDHVIRDQTESGAARNYSKPG